MATDAPGRSGHARRLARNTAFFSFATGLSRLLGLAREVVAASYFGVTAAMSAFTIAFQVPNLVRALFADSALQGAFVPVFSELLEKGERKEAFRVASSLFFLICLVLGGVTALFILFAEPIMSLFAPGFDDDPALKELTVNLARLMFPIVVLLALSGLVVGMLNSFDALRRPRARPGGVEPRDHRGAGRARAGPAGGRRDLRVRDRHPPGHDRAVPVAAAVAARARRDA